MVFNKNFSIVRSKMYALDKIIEDDRADNEDVSRYFREELAILDRTCDVMFDREA